MHRTCGNLQEPRIPKPRGPGPRERRLRLLLPFDVRSSQVWVAPKPPLASQVAPWQVSPGRLKKDVMCHDSERRLERTLHLTYNKEQWIAMDRYGQHG